MTAIDNYLIYALLVCPLIAAIFVSLIPRGDFTSRKTISRFFSFFVIILYIRLVFFYAENGFLTGILLELNIISLKLLLSLTFTYKKIIFLGLISLALLLNTLFYEPSRPRVNFYSAAPFLWVFILFVCLGDGRVSFVLPVLSLSQLINYLLIAYSRKNRRGTSIFYTGVFLFSCDIFVIILMNMQWVGLTQLPTNVFNFLYLIPGFSRLFLPLFAPYLKRFFLNLEDYEGPFICIGMQLAGFILLTTFKQELEISSTLTLFIGIASSISVLYISLLSVIDEAQLLPFYILTFYATLAAFLLFVSSYDYHYDLLSYAVISSNMIIFLHSNKVYFFLKKGSHYQHEISRIRGAWFFALILSAGLPGIGLGTVLWPALYYCLKSNNLTTWAGLILNPWFYIGISFIVALVMISYAVMLKTRQSITVLSMGMKMKYGEDPFKNKPLFLIPVAAMILCWLITLLIFLFPQYASHGS